MAVRRDEAIILRTRDYSESDRLITFFTRNQGQLTGIAKGARRSKKRFVHTLEPLSHVSITYADRASTGLVRIDGSELKNAFTALRGDIARLGYASVSCEIVLKMSPERQANPSLFTLLCQNLEQLELGAEPENSSLLFPTCNPACSVPSSRAPARTALSPFPRAGSFVKPTTRVPRSIPFPWVL